MCSSINKIICCSFFGIRKLAEYFQDLDVVPSDFAAGLVLLRKQQKRQEHSALVRAIEEQQVLDSQVCKLIVPRSFKNEIIALYNV